MENLRTNIGSRSPKSCRTKACIGIIRLTKDMRSILVYRSKCFGILSWIQCLLGILIMILYVLLYTDVLSQFSSFKYDLNISNNNFGGILASGTQILAAAVTLLAVDESTYCWLHTAMSLHVLTIVGHFLLSINTLVVILPGVVYTKAEFPHEREHLTIGTDRVKDIQAMYWKHVLLIIITIGSFLSVFIGTFLASATGYGVFCGPDAKDKSRKSSVSKESKQSKLVKFKSFEPTNVAANLGSEQFTSFENYMQAREDSIIYINRHAMTKSQCDSST